MGGENSAGWSTEIKSQGGYRSRPRQLVENRIGLDLINRETLAWKIMPRLRKARRRLFAPAQDEPAESPPGGQ